MAWKVNSTLPETDVGTLATPLERREDWFPVLGPWPFQSCNMPFSSHGMFSGLGTATPVWFCLNLPYTFAHFFANFIMYLFSCLFIFGCIDLHCHAEAFSNFGNWDYSLLVAYWFLVAVVFSLGRTGSVVAKRFLKF